MNSTSSSIEIFSIPTAISVPNLKNFSIDENNRPSSNLNVESKPKSLISIYDNSTENPLISFIGILGGNARARAFEKRIISSGYSNPILCDEHWKEKENYVSLETFEKFSPTIIILTDRIPSNFDESFHRFRSRALIIDGREISDEKLSPIFGTYRAFGNLSDWEIANGTTRVAVAIDSNSPLNLVEFIEQLQCFPRGFLRLNSFDYEHLQRKSFENLLFPLFSSLFIVAFFSIISMIEYKNEYFQSRLVFRQASSISGATSITLLSLVLFIEPIDEFFQLIHWSFFKTYPLKTRTKFWNEWSKSRLYLVGFALVFAYLHLIFLLFSRLDSNFVLFLIAFLLGLVCLICLTIVCFVDLPWISERLLWIEYRLFSFHLSLICLIFAFLHVFIHWILISETWNVKFFSMILPMIVLILRSTIFLLLSPTVKYIFRS